MKFLALRKFSSSFLENKFKTNNKYLKRKEKNIYFYFIFNVATYTHLSHFLHNSFQIIWIHKIRMHKLIIIVTENMNLKYLYVESHNTFQVQKSK